MIIVPFKAEHAAMIDLQEGQRKVGSEVQSKALELSGEAVTGMVEDRVIFCFGRVRQWEGRYILWALLSADACKHMLAITRAARRAISLMVGDGRLEAIIESEFEEGRRFAKLIGLQFHHHEEAFLPSGGDADIYVRFV